MVRRRRMLALAAAVGCAAIFPFQASVQDRLPEVLVSRQLLEAANLSIGNVISLSSDAGGARQRQFRVAGSYEPVPDPMRLGAVRHELRMHLPELITLAADPSDPMAAESVD